jgi:hypothetical protein
MVAAVEVGRLVRHCASFETSLREAPQDEGLLNAIKNSLMVRSARSARI